MFTQNGEQRSYQGGRIFYEKSNERKSTKFVAMNVGFQS
jgi:hypothetical protein